MTIENTVSPDAETLNPAPEVVETPELTTPDAEGQEPQEEAKPQLSDAEKEAKALKRRIDRLTQQKYQLSAENDSLRRRPAEQSDPKPEQFDDARFDAEVQRRAEQIANQQSTAKRLDTVEADLKKTVGASYDDFIEDLESAGKAGSVFLKTALELDDSAKVLAHFAGDRDELDKVLQMSPVRQAAFMGRLSAQLETDKPKVSTAPKPLAPLTSRSTSRVSSSSLSDEDMVRQIRSTR